LDLFNEKKKTPENSNRDGEKNQKNDRQPLATRMRPDSLNELVGQKHLIGKGKMLRRMIESGVMGSVIFYGPPSTGKTTLGHVISREINARFETLNAVLDGIKELKKVVAGAEKLRKINQSQTILFVDEIHRWNKAQQDALLPHVEEGIIHLIGATTENPFYSLVSPLLSRCQLFELYPLRQEHVKVMIERALSDETNGLGTMKVDVSEDAKNHLAEFAGGDIRNALNALEIAVRSTEPDKDGIIHILKDVARQSIQKRTVRFAKGGDEHYHYASAFIKSMRGSDPDAALYWMAAMLEGGEDPNFIFRRMLIFASEDVGLAQSNALTTVNSAHESFLKCGMPEGLYFLTHAALHLTLAPKSNSTKAIFNVQSHIKKKGTGTVPEHLQDKTANSLKARYLDVENASDAYKYPHRHKNHWTPQRYLPEKINENWYEPSDQGHEGKLWRRLLKIKGEIEKKD